MRGHTAYGAVEDLRRGTVMEGSGLFGVHDMSFVQEVVVPELENRRLDSRNRWSRREKFE